MDFSPVHLLLALIGTAFVIAIPAAYLYFAFVAVGLLRDIRDSLRGMRSSS